LIGCCWSECRHQYVASLSSCRNNYWQLPVFERCCCRYLPIHRIAVAVDASLPLLLAVSCHDKWMQRLRSCGYSNVGVVSCGVATPESTSVDGTVAGGCLVATVNSCQLLLMCPVGVVDSRPFRNRSWSLWSLVNALCDSQRRCATASPR
jgi:hypothetical protein